MTEFGQADGYPLLAAERFAEGEALARIYVSAGIHGDEPAGSLALLALLRQNWFDGRISWQLLLALNPGGLARGIRETPAGLDANRDYRHGETEEVRAHLTWLREEGGGVTLELLVQPRASRTRVVGEHGAAHVDRRHRRHPEPAHRRGLALDGADVGPGQAHVVDRCVRQRCARRPRRRSRPKRSQRQTSRYP